MAYVLVDSTVELVAISDDAEAYQRRVKEVDLPLLRAVSVSNRVVHRSGWYLSSSTSGNVQSASGFEISYPISGAHRFAAFSSTAETFDHPLDTMQAQPGSREFDAILISLSTDAPRGFSGEISYERGSFYAAARRALEASVRWRPSEHHSIVSSLSDEHLVDLSQRLELVAQRKCARWEVALSERVAFAAQYRSERQSGASTLESSLTWEPHPTTELSFIFRDRRSRDTGAAESTEKTILFEGIIRFRP